MYNNETLGAMDKICPVAAKAQLGTIIDTLVYDLDNDLKYSGSLLDANKIAALNNMCGIAKTVQLGTVINNILVASKNGTTVSTMSDATKILINKMCKGIQLANLGEVLQESIVTINTHGALSDEAKVLTFTVPSQVGDSTIDNTEHTIAITVPNATVVTALVSTFTLSTGASAKVGLVSQVSGTTENDFTNPVVYSIKSESGDVVIDWTVTITIAEA